ncbi:MAG: nucleotide sugar dehydrogenase, partial [Magnetococcales bacterium]|nr:nucleotide sugar dehydrogenase [Magnetococcales bacterium]
LRMQSVPLTGEGVASYDLVLLVTDHDGLDYALVAHHAKQIVDTRNLFGRLGINDTNIHKA